MEEVIEATEEVVTVSSVELEQLIELGQAQLDALGHIYSAQVFCLSVLAVVGVCLLLYAFIQKFI